MLCKDHFVQVASESIELQMLLFPNALCCSLYEPNCVCAVTKFFTKFLPANNLFQLLRVTRKCSCTSAGNAQAQLHLLDDQQRAFGINNISNYVDRVCMYSILSLTMISNDLSMTFDCKFLKTLNLSHSMITLSKLHQHPLNFVKKKTFWLYFNNDPNRPLDDLWPQLHEHP